MLMPCLCQAQPAASGTACFPYVCKAEYFNSPLASGTAQSCEDAPCTTPLTAAAHLLQQPSACPSVPPAPLTSLLAARLWLSTAMRPGAPGPTAFLCPGVESPAAPPQLPRHQWQLEAGATGAGHWARAAAMHTRML